MFTKTFRQLSNRDSAIAGGKGSSLGELTNAGVTVPPGFVILASAFEQFLEETDLDVEIDSIFHKVKHKDINSVEKASEKIKALVMDKKMPKNLISEITREFKKLKAKFVAVRSSATAEDSLSAAWAGQLDSFLNTTEKDLLKNVQRCWSSLFTPRAIFYRFEKKLHKQKISVAVVVQKMVQSEVSGICFTVHPVTQDKKQMIIEAGYGLGEAIVSGQITPDSYVLHKDDFSLIDVNISEQKITIVRRGNQNVNRQLPARKGGKQKLSGKQIVELAKICLAIEKHYKKPQDIEWALERGKFYITQSRPITTLNDT